MSIRTIRYTFDGSGNTVPQTDCIGVQFEDNATAVEYAVSNSVENDIISSFSAVSVKYRIDFDTDAKGYNPSGIIERSNEKIRREIPADVACCKECRVNLEVIVEGENGVVATLSSPQSRICFSPVTRTNIQSFAENLPDISSITAYLENIKRDVSDKKVSVQEILEAVQADKSIVSSAKTACENSQSAVNTIFQNITAIDNRISAITLPEAVLPQVTSADNGKFLRVSNGSWRAVSISDGSGVDF